MSENVKLFRDDRAYRDKQIAERLGIGRSTLWAWVAQNRLPAPTKFGPRTSAWTGAVLNEWVKNREAA